MGFEGVCGNSVDSESAIMIWDRCSAARGAEEDPWIVVRLGPSQGSWMLLTYSGVSFSAFVIISSPTKPAEGL